MNDSNVLVGLSQTYIETLTDELTTAEYCYNEYHKAAQKAEDEYNQSLLWENCLKDYLNKVGTTYDMVAQLNPAAANMASYASNVCTTVGLAKDATSILTICVRCLSDHAEVLKKSVKDLLEIIDCLNDPTLDPNVSIMKCLDDFKMKVEEGVVACLAAVKEVLNLMKCMFELEYTICSTETKPEGLVEFIKDLQKILDCSYTRGGAVSDVNCDEVNAAYATPTMDVLNCPTCKDGCGEAIVPAKIEMDCNDDAFKPSLCEECGNTFHEELKNESKRASQQTCYAKCVWDYFKDLEQSAKSNRDATKAALDAAEAAKSKC